MVQYVRLLRVSTMSYLTIRLSTPMNLVDAEPVLKEKFPLWQVVAGSMQAITE